MSFTILGAIWGSFVAALCSRWPQGKTTLNGRSHCDQCGQKISFYDLVPIISHLLLNGKCRNCGQEIGLASLVIETVCALIGVVALLMLPDSQAVAAAIFFWALMPLVILDYQHLWLPDRLVLLLATAGVLVAPMLTPSINVVDRIIGMSAGFLSLEVIRQVYKKYRQHDGMGAGDPKLFGALGIWLGWQALPVVLLLASGIGIALFSISGMTANHRRIALPFGSYLGVAACLAVLLSHHFALI